MHGFPSMGRPIPHSGIYIPEGGSQLAWVKWRTPKEPGYITITVAGNCSVSSSEIVAQIVDLDKNPPPDPQANDRNDGFSIPAKPVKPNVTSLTWGEWDCWWHEYWVWHSGDEDEDGLVGGLRLVGICLALLLRKPDGGTAYQAG